MDDQEKESLIKNVKGWINVDNQIKTLQKELRRLRKEKKTQSHSLIETMKTHNIDCLDSKESKLMYSRKIVKKPLSKKHLIQALGRYFKDEGKATDLEQYIMNSRDEKTVEKITRK